MKKGISVTLFVLLLLLGCAVGFALYLKGQREEAERQQAIRSEESARAKAALAEARLPEPKVKVTYRNALTGPGLVYHFENFSGKDFPMKLTIRNPSVATNFQTGVMLSSSPKNRFEVGHAEGWIGRAGDVITVDSPGFKALRIRIQ